MTQLLYAHLALRLVKLRLDDKVDEFTSYKKMKQTLNSMGTFSMFLYNFGENWEPSKNNNDDIDESSNTTTLPTSVPKRNRVPWFNSFEGGKRLRLSIEGHTLLSSVYPKKKCVLCDMKTTSKCAKCQVHICRFPFGRNRISCWAKHHTRQTIEKTKRY